MTKTLRQKYLTEEEYAKFMDAIDNAQDYVFFLLCGNLGLRVGEAIRLRLQDLDFTNGYIRVPTLKQERQKNIVKGTIKRGQLPKTYIDLPLKDDMAKVLKKYIEVYKIKDWLFPHDDGLHMHKFKAQRLFKKYAKIAELDTVYSVHSLRHFKGVQTYETLEDIYAVKEMLRHKVIGSSQVYTHMSINKKKDIVNRMETIGKKQAK
jgi:integrase